MASENAGEVKHSPGQTVRNETESPIEEELFPLQLTPFEKFVIWDESRSHPMTSFVELHFDSPLNTRLLEESLRSAVHRNPLLASTIVDKDGELFWSYDKEYRPILRSEVELSPLPGGRPMPIDLFRECGTRFWYAQREIGSRVLIQLHHACTDGIGLRRVLTDTLTGYAKGSATKSADLSPPAKVTSKLADWQELDNRLLARRFDFSDTYGEPPDRTISTWQRIKNAYYFHFQLPQPLQGSQSAAALEQDSEAQEKTEPLRHAILDRELSDQAITKAKTQGYSINDVALALLFHTCTRWFELQGDSNGRSRIRLLMPYDLRSRVDLRMPAANRLSFAFLGRTQSQCHDLAALVKSVRDEIEDIKETRLQMDFLAALEGAAQKPRLFKWVLGKSHRMSTAVLTYTGDVSRGMKRYFPDSSGARVVGDALLKNILAAPPVRRNTNIALGLCVNWGQICISSAWNRDALTAGECEQFLSLYEASWASWTRG